MTAVPELQATVESLYRDCRDLARYIANARKEIAQIRPSRLKQEKIPRAGEELDAIVKATEQATNTIMNAAETIMGSPGDEAVINDACMEIFEACSFQDITGQRITKVVKTLKHIEERLDGLQAAWGAELGFEEPEEEEPEGEEALLNGPQLEGEGIAQDDVDRLLEEAGEATEKKQAEKKEEVSQDDIDALFD